MLTLAYGWGSRKKVSPLMEPPPPPSPLNGLMKELFFPASLAYSTISHLGLRADETYSAFFNGFSAF